jgi:hypothetical protein
VDVRERQRREPLTVTVPDRAAARAAAGLGVGVASGVDAARAALADGPQPVEPGADVLGGELGEPLPTQARYQVLLGDGGVASVGGLAEVVDGDVVQPVRQEGCEAVLVVTAGTPRLLAAIFSVSLASAPLREAP